MIERDLAVFDAWDIASYLGSKCLNKPRNNQQGKSVVMCCKESDESVVAMKLRPMNLGNKLEGKTQLAKGF